MIVAGSDFSTSVQTSFGYVVDDLNFSLADASWHERSASWIVSYVSPKRAVQLVWGLKDAQFYFSVRRVHSNGTVATVGEHGEGWFYIFELMCHREPSRDWAKDLDIGTASPSREQLEEKIRLNAEMLRQYGWDILQGTTWFDSNSGAFIKEAV